MVRVTTPASVERNELCKLFDELGPDAPTLCGGWRTVDLAAHLVVRERRPDAAPGVLVKPLASYTEKVQQRIAQGPWAEIVERIRSGPPRLSPWRIDAVDRLVNTIEFFVHHEDVRRANGRGPRTTELAMDEALWRNVSQAPWFLARRLRGAGLELRWAATARTVRARRGEPTVHMTGPPGELLLYLFGRQRAAEVDIVGPAEAVEALGRARFGI